MWREILIRNVGLGIDRFVAQKCRDVEADGLGNVVLCNSAMFSTAVLIREF